MSLLFLRLPAVGSAHAVNLTAWPEGAHHPHGMIAASAAAAASLPITLIG
jgi:hypothetical protein